MRKRLITGAIAVVVIAFGAYMLSQPRKGTVEWHKARYRESLNAVFGDSRWQLYRRGLARKAGQAYGTYEVEHLEKMDAHRAALVRLGYLVEKELALANRTPSNAYLGFMVARSGLLEKLGAEDGEFAWIAPTSNTVRLVGSVVALKELEAWVRRKDVPLKE